MPDIVAALATCGSVVVEAPPGAGKTTRVPRALWERSRDSSDEIWVLQPRRLPARLAAKRVAEELGEKPGDTVGYSVRFEDLSSPRTRIRFVTEGVLIRRLLVNPTLRGVSCVVLDEFHERHLASDLALALLRRLRHRQRPDLKICVMSATLDAQPVATFLGGGDADGGGAARDCPRIRSEGRRFDVSIEHLGLPDERPLAIQVASVVRRLLKDVPEGDLLVFLPGAGDIRRCQEALATTTATLPIDVLPLHGDLPLEGQARVVARSPRRKVILATNVAETSVTIDGVSIVVDTGLAKIPSHSPWTGLSTLVLGKISQASAIQRAGRAGRTRPGLAIRLFSEADFQSRRPFDLPEIARLDLAELTLVTKAFGIHALSEIDWLTPPPAVAVTAAQQLLLRLGAVLPDGGLTPLGRSLLRFPVHPRLARVIVEGEQRGVAKDAALLAALISEKDIRERGGRGGQPHGARAGAGAGTGGSGRSGGRTGEGDGIDLLALMELFERARSARFAHGAVRTLGLEPHQTSVVEQSRKQLVAALSTGAPGATTTTTTTTTGARFSSVEDRAAQDRALARSVLTGFPDRVARVRDPGSRVVLLSTGGTAELGYVSDSEFLIAVDAAEGRTSSGRGALQRAPTTTVRLGCGIDSDWLADLDGFDLQASDAAAFDAESERVLRRSRVTYGALVLDETIRVAEPSPETAAILADAAVARGVETFGTPGALDRLRARLTLLATLEPRLAVPVLDARSLRNEVVGACAGLRGFAELRAIDIADRLEANLPADVRASLSRELPPFVSLPGGRRLEVHYVPAQPPWIESRLQDFFGLSQGPRIARGRLALTLHLLAPNGRAVQVTGDLESFWRQHYPGIRRELQRRYPRHPWPEDGATAAPPPPAAPRRR